jgi:hypothetical protein
MRMADAHWQRQMVHELLMNPADMEVLLKDPFANYVVQTAVCKARKVILRSRY